MMRQGVHEVGEAAILTCCRGVIAKVAYDLKQPLLLCGGGELARIAEQAVAREFQDGVVLHGRPVKISRLYTP